MTHPEHTTASSDTRRPGSVQNGTRRRPLAPDTSRLEERSARAWTEAMAVRPLGRGRYAVESGSGSTYLVSLPESDCGCPDSTFRGERCKHLRRVAIEVTEGRVPPPGKRRGVCAACGRESFVPESGPSVCQLPTAEAVGLSVDSHSADTNESDAS